MFTKRMALTSVVVCFLAVMLVGLLSQVIAAPQAEQTGTQRRQRQGQRQGQRFDPEQMQRMMAERLKETLEVGDEEWKVFEPRIMKVLTLSRQTGAAGGMGMMFRGQRGAFGQRGRRTTGDQAQERELTEIEKTTQELQTVLDDKEAKPKQIKEKLTALRNSREKARKELATAQKQLREIVSVRQEAQLVLMGLLN